MRTINPHAQAIRQQLAPQVEQFLRSGGRVNQIPRGVSGGRKDGKVLMRPDGTRMRYGANYSQFPDSRLDDL